MITSSFNAPFLLLDSTPSGILLSCVKTDFSISLGLPAAFNKVVNLPICYYLFSSRNRFDSFINLNGLNSPKLATFPQTEPSTSEQEKQVETFWQQGHCHLSTLSPPLLFSSHNHQILSCNTLKHEHCPCKIKKSFLLAHHTQI